MVQRVAAVMVVLVGTALIGFNPNRWDLVLLTLPRGHGIHVRDVVGSFAVVGGLVLLWFAPPRRRVADSPRPPDARGGRPDPNARPRPPEQH